MITILGSIVNIIGEDLNDHLMSAGIFTLMMNKDIHASSYEESGSYGLDLDLLTISY